MILPVEPLTKAAFAPWGEVLEREGAALRSINAGTTDRLHALARVAVEGGAPIVSIFRGRRRAYPHAIDLLERHSLGSQTFFPLQSFDWLVVVGDDPRAAETAGVGLRCFRAGGGQGVSYNAGAWHYPLLVLQPAQEFLVVDRDAPENNCEEVVLPARAQATVAP